MKNKKTIVKLSMLLILIIAITISVTYAYFQFKVNGVESSTTIIVDATQLSIEYVGSNMIKASKISPSWSEKKYFNVRINNESNKSVNFSVNVVVEDSNFYTTATPNLGYLKYKLTKCTDKNDTECTEVIQDSTLLNIQSGQKSVATISETAGTKTNYYALEFIYPDTGVPQKQRGEDGLLYHFSGFITIGSAQGEGTNLNMATVTIDLDGGTYNGNTTVSIPYGELYYLEYPQKEGYRFKEWKIVSGTAEIKGKGLIANSTEVSIKATYDIAFSVDSWETIAAHIKAGKTNMYKVGDTKEIRVNGFTNGETDSNGLYTVRIANNSNYDCILDSETACGFVVEFVDIITGYNMNPAGTYNGTYYQYGTNLGGWPSSSMYKYINGDTTDHLTYDGTNATLYSKLPSELRNVIADTNVISGHGSEDKNTERTDENWESTDKLYLLSPGEIWSDCLTADGNSGYTCYDTASYPYNGSGATTTRQLDYYQSIGVSTSNYSGAIKQKNGSNEWLWLRGAGASNSSYFRGVYHDGRIDATNADYSGGVAPAFRIA